jgi:hypothetical protein
MMLRKQSQQRLEVVDELLEFSFKLKLLKQ